MRTNINRFEIILVSSSHFGGKYPQRADRLLKALSSISPNIIGIESYNPINGMVSVLKNRRKEIKWVVYSGFRAGLAGLVLSLFWNKWIYDIVEVKWKLCSDNWRGMTRVFIPLIDLLERLMVKRAYVVFAAHPTAYRYASNIRKEVFLIPNSYEDTLFDHNRYDRHSLRTYYKVNYPVAVYIGKLTPMYAKFLVDVIKAMDFVVRAIPDAEFWIFGDGPSKGSLQKVANKNVKFKGYIEHRKVPEVLTIADVGVHAYDTESLKMIEWLAMGLPVIAPKGLQLDGVIECEWEPEEIARQLIRVFKNPYRNPKKMPTWRESARLILEVLDRLDEGA